MYYPSRDFYIDACIAREFNSLEEVQEKKKQIKIAARKFYDNYPGTHKEMNPIVVISELSQIAIDKTKRNMLRVNVVIYLEKSIFAFDEINLELAREFVNEIA